MTTDDLRPEREQIVDSMICDLIVALSLNRNKDWNKTRSWIEAYTRSIIDYVDEHPPLRVTASGSITLIESAGRR